MTEKNATTGDPTDPRPPCAICKSTDHTTGFHNSGVAPENAVESAK